MSFEGRAGAELPVPLREVLLQWGRIGCIGFGGPPAHIALLRELCVTRRAWLSEQQFEDAIAATNLLPGPASTQLAIFSAWRVAGVPGALVGGAAFIVPGLVLIVVLAAIFLAGSPPEAVLALGAGAGAAVPAVAFHAGTALVPGSWARVQTGGRGRWLAYVLLGGLAAAAVGPWLVLVLLACGTVELVWRRGWGPGARALHPGVLSVLAAMAGAGGLGALAWTAFKVGALSYGGGFVIIPLMQADAIDQQWMTNAQFLNAVALGQITPGPVVHTVAVVGYAAAGVGGAALAAAVAFGPSFSFVLLGADRFDRLSAHRGVRAFLSGAGPAAIGAIIGSSLPLAASLDQEWQYGLLAVAAMGLLALRRSVVLVLVGSGLAGLVVVLAGAPLPS